MTFTDKVAVITGGARGIGAACAEDLMAKGAHVVLADINADQVNETADQLRAKYPGRKALAYRVDVRQQAECFALADFAVRELGRIDVLVNSAGITSPAPSLEMSEDAWNTMLAINLSGSFFCCQGVARHMQEHGGAIINISSIASHGGWPKRVSYAAAKHGITAITATLGVEWGEFNIRVNAIAPVWTATEMIMVGLKSGLIVQEKLEGAIPLGRIAQVEDLARVVSFLASDDAAMITAQTIYVDGGFLAGAPINAIR